MRFGPEVAVAPRPDNEPRYVRSYVCTRFAIGLLTMAVAAIMVAVRLRTVPAILFAAGFALFLPQFFTPPAVRIAHGVLMIVGCVWLAWDSARREAKDPQLAAA